MTIGEKIKHYRLKQGLTQSQLAGNFITRNMLSQIENGTANPSLATIEYLTKKLSLPQTGRTLIKNSVPHLSGHGTANWIKMNYCTRYAFLRKWEWADFLCTPV